MLPLPPVAAPAVQGLAAPTSTTARFGAMLRAHDTPSPPGGARPATATRWTRAALDDVERARERLDGMLAAAQRGRTFTAQELLAVQAQAYRYSQTVEMASKIVEQAVQSVKQAVQTQV